MIKVSCIKIDIRVILSAQFSDAIARTQAFFGEGNGPVLGVRWGCFGNEISLLYCSMSPSTCSHNRDAGVTCEGIYHDFYTF